MANRKPKASITKSLLKISEKIKEDGLKLTRNATNSVIPYTKVKKIFKKITQTPNYVQKYQDVKISKESNSHRKETVMSILYSENQYIRSEWFKNYN